MLEQMEWASQLIMYAYRLYNINIITVVKVKKAEQYATRFTNIY